MLIVPLFVGLGTAVNVVAVVAGATLGMALGHRLPERTRATVTDALGLVTLLIGGLNAMSVTSPALLDRVGPGAPVLVVLGALLLGGIVGSLLDIEIRLEQLGDWVRRRLGARASGPDGAGEGAVAARERFIDGFVSASLLFCVGPLTILGALSDGLGRGADQLILKSVLDGFAAMAFAASLGIGVMASALVVAVVQGALTLVGALFGGVLPDAHLDALTATGGLMLLGLGIRLLALRAVPVGNLLPALLVAPLLVQLVAVLR